MTRIYWQSIALLAVLLQGVSALSTVSLYIHSGCSGSHMDCSSFADTFCCGSGQVFYASAIVQTATAGTAIDAFDKANCEGDSVGARPDVCLDPPFTTVSASAFISQAFTKPGNSTEGKNCLKPDSLTLIGDDGQETTVTIPEGHYEEYEAAFIERNRTRLLELKSMNSK